MATAGPDFGVNEELLPEQLPVVLELWRIWPLNELSWGVTAIHGVTMLKIPGPQPAKMKSGKQQLPATGTTVQ